jgi:hypothetical protein
MDAIAALRRRADRWFRFAKTTRDAQLKTRALALGEQCLAEAEARDTERTARAHGFATGREIGRLSPLRRAALLQISRLDENIEAFEAEAPRYRSPRANILDSLRERRRALLQACGLDAANDPGGRP